MLKYTSITFLIVSLALISPPGFAAKKSMRPQMPPTVVETVKAKQVDYQAAIQETGSLSAFQGIVVRPEIGGRITQIFFKSGEKVTEGQPLIEINPSIFKAELMQNAANLKLSTVDYKRALQLYKQHAISEADLDKTEAKMLADKGAVQESQAKLDQLLIRAPFTGKIGLRKVSLGDYVGTGQDIANLQTLQPIRVEFAVPEVYLSQLAIGQKVNIRTDAYPNEIFTGKVYAFESLVDPDTRTLDVRASIPNEKEKLLPGTFAEVTLYLGKAEKVIMVPQTALVYSAEAYYVYKVIKNHAKKTKVAIGHRDNKNVVITKGIEPDDIIVTAGQIKLYDGAAVITR